MKYKGIIFDLDGVICSTDECHYQAWKKLADEIGAAGFNREDNARQRGVSRMESLEVVLEKAPHQYTQEEKAALAEHKNEMYRQLLANMSPADLSHEVKDTLDALRAKGLLLAIGSSSKNAPFILDRIGGVPAGGGVLGPGSRRLPGGGGRGVRRGCRDRRRLRHGGHRVCVHLS